MIRETELKVDLAKCSSFNIIYLYWLN